MVTARYPPFVGGTESHVADVSRRLTGMGTKVTVLTTSPGVSEADERNEAGVTVVRVPAQKIWNDVYFARHLTRHICVCNPDLVHVQGYHTFVAPMAMWAARRAGIPYVVTFHSGGHDSRLRRMLRPVQRRLLRRWLMGAERMIAVSEYERSAFERSFRLAPGSIAVIPTGVDDAFIEVDRPPPSDPPSLISIGRLVEYKGHHLVIEALAHVHRSLPGTRLRVIGDGGDRAALETLAARLGLGEAVHFSYVPAADRAALAQELAASSVAVFMSSYESQGIAGYEAVATGARVVIGRGTALDELECYPGVELVDRDDRHAVSQALVRQLSAPALTSRPTLPSTLTTAVRLESLYREVLAV
jgi:glycosyltransferase involved in cell wall biosynthesis